MSMNIWGNLSSTVPCAVSLYSFHCHDNNLFVFNRVSNLKKISLMMCFLHRNLVPDLFPHALYGIHALHILLSSAILMKWVKLFVYTVSGMQFTCAMVSILILKVFPSGLKLATYVPLLSSVF